jgi:integrase
MPIHPKTFAALLEIPPKHPEWEPGKKTGKIADGNGLWLVVGEGRQRSWVYKFSLNSKPDEIGLGSAHKVGLTEARAKAEAAYRLVIAGQNPKDEKKAAKAAAIAAAAPPVAELSLYELAKKAVRAVGPPGAESQLKWVAMLHPRRTEGLTAKTPAEVTRQDVIDCLEAIHVRAPKGVMKKQVESALYNLFEWCAASGKLGAPETAINPADFKKKRFKTLLTKVTAKPDPQASVPWREIGEVVTKMRERRAMSFLALEWTLLSAVRVGNAITADWSEIDREARVWTIPAHKMKIKKVGPHRVPLTDRHLQILDAIIEPEDAPASGLVFPADDGRPFTSEGIRWALRSVCPTVFYRADGSDREVSVHGLRATFRTWGEMQLHPVTKTRLYDRETLELCLAHVVGDAAEQAYKREDNVESRRPVMDAWAAFVAKPYEAVTPLRRAS